MQRMKLVTVVAEASLEGALEKELAALGARGWTVVDARGVGARGERPAGFSLDRNLRFELLCPEPLARRIAERIKERFFVDYAVVCWLCDAEVLRPKKFGADEGEAPES